MLFPLPGGPDKSVIDPFGKPPEIISSKPGIPVLTLSILLDITLCSD
jgi:hypothetical protein